MASETHIRWITKRETELSNSYATSLGPIKPVQQLVFAKRLIGTKSQLIKASFIYMHETSMNENLYMEHEQLPHKTLRVHSARNTQCVNAYIAQLYKQTKNKTKKQQKKKKEKKKKKKRKKTEEKRRRKTHTHTHTKNKNKTKKHAYNAQKKTNLETK